MTDTYSYDNGDKLLSVSGGNDPRTFSYDGAGRTIGIHRASGTTAFSYDYESRVTQITKPGMTNNSFTYNGLDTRVGMSDSSGSKVFKRNGVGVTAPVLSDGTAQFTPSGEVRGGTKTTFHSGMKNSTTQTSSAGVVSAEKSYDAFGNVVSASGVWKSQFGYAGKFGYQSDPDTGLKLLGHRYYDSDTGRFLTRDPIKDGRNWYSYCGNNPVNRIDPTGLFEIVFTGTELQFWENIDGQRVLVGRCDAFSGSPGSSKSDQDKENYGPIPEGEYWIDVSNIQTRADERQWWQDDLFVGSYESWGGRRTQIHPKPGNNTNRSEFFIHGGANIGSAGCIDVGSKMMNYVVMILIRYAKGKKVRLIVDYSNWNGKVPGTKEKPVSWGAWYAS